MTVGFASDPMAKKKSVESSPPPAPEPAPDPAENRYTVFNMKGTTEERDFLRSISDDSGISVTEIIRRAVAKWSIERGYKPPAHWKAK